MEAQCSVCRQAAAKFVCSCAFPPIPVCMHCLGKHAETAGTHIPTLILQHVVPQVPRPVQGNEVCDVCAAKPALRFCLCAVPLRKYCEDCDIAHYRKTPLLNHSEHPMSAFAIATSGKTPLETFKKKQQYINDLQLRLGQELVTFDAFVHKVEEKFDGLIALIVAKKEGLRRDLLLQRVKLTGLLNNAQQSIERKRYAEAFEVKNYIDALLFNGYQSSAPPEIMMFAGAIDLDKVCSSLEKSVTYEIAFDLQQQIPVITGTSLKLYHPQTLRVVETTLAQATRIDAGTAYCYIRPDTLLCCGGTNHNSVCEVNIKTSAVEWVANLKAVRAYTGLWPYRNGCVYAFGGQVKPKVDLNTAEIYSIPVKTWTDMESRLRAAKCLCSVCEHADNLYISGYHQGLSYSQYSNTLVSGSEGSSIERFNPLTEAFTLLRSDNIRVSSIMCSDEKGLYCIRQGTIEQADASNAAFTVKANIPPLGNGHYWLRCPMKWPRGELMNVLCSDQGAIGLFRFNPATWQFTLTATFAQAAPAIAQPAPMNWR